MQKFTPAKKAEDRIGSNDQQKNSISAFAKMVQDFEGQIKLALPKHLSPSKMTRIILTEVRKNPKLAECEKTSFFGAIITCAQLGLEPGAALGHAYLLPYWNSRKSSYECQLIIGYQGKIDLAERDGRVTISSSVVYEKDFFDYEEGDNPFIKHKPYLGSDDPGKIIASYAVARYADGRKKMRVLRLYEILAAKTASASGGGKNPYGPWLDHFQEMAMKTAIHRLFKQLPKNPEMARVMELSDKELMDEPQNLSDVYNDFTQEHSLPVQGQIESNVAVNNDDLKLEKE